jgi:peptidyl-prolyl cis-trans isomerase SurA
MPMNKIYSLFFLLFFVTTLSAQTLFTYGNDAVSKEEFLKGYNKNRAAIANKKQSLREYLDLYIKFKLKVKNGEDAHLDTLSTILEEVNNFRSQIEPSYMNNDSVVNDMANEAFQRQQKDIHLIHYYVLMTDKMSPADTMIAYNAIYRAYDAFNRIRQKRLSPRYLVMDINNDHGTYTPLQNGDLGYITAFTLPYQYENIAYGLKPGEVSKPYRTKNGWHFLRNAGERKAIGKWKVAQIFFAIPPRASEEDILKIKNKADSVYHLLLSGSDFAVLAKQYSQDKNSYMNGGQMPEFGTGKYDTAFAAQVFALKKDNDLSAPFRTSFGYHIVKRLKHSTPPSIANEDYLNALKQEVLKDARGSIAKEKVMADIAIKVKYKRNDAISDADLLAYADSVISNKTITTYPISNSIIFSFATENITGQDWLEYVLTQTSEKQTVNQPMLNNYINSAILNYYQNHLEEYNADFKYQMREFKEGNLLFEVMQKNVWNKAAIDSAGLENYYEQHKEKYVWVKSADLVLFNCADTNATKEVSNALKVGIGWRTIAKESQGRIQADSNRYELSQIQVPPGTVFKEGLLSTPLISIDNTASMVLVLKLFPDNEPRSFADAKGMVINDYQNLLEEQWLKELQKKYPVTINEKVFKSLLQ